MQWYESLGDPITNLGGAVVPNTRVAPVAQVTVGTIAADGQTDTQAARLILRRQLRSLLNNSPMKFQGYLYLLYSDDPENNGWYVPDQSSLQDISGSVGLATGFWQLAQQNWAVAGHQRTHREARLIFMKDLRTGLYARDTLGWIYALDYNSLPALALTYLPNGSSSAVLTVTGQVVATAAMPTGEDGGVCGQAVGLADLDTIAYERPESALNLSDVIVYDRMGQITGPSGGPDTNWVEFYGPDWPGNWQTSGQPNDTPVLDNGLVRVRYDHSVGNPGFRVDAWTGSAWVEQGKMTFYRDPPSGSMVDTWVSATLREWTPDRAVVSVVLACSADAVSRERVYITVQRGQPSARFEYYPAPHSDGTLAGGQLIWTPNGPDVNDSIIKIESQTQPPPVGSGKILPTAGNGSGTWGSATLGASSFANCENHLALLRCSATATLTAFQTNFAVVQSSAVECQVGNGTGSYGTAENYAVIATTDSPGYLSARVGFVATEADQVMEAESMTLGTGTSSTADAAASNGFAATATRTTDANAHTTRATWPNGYTGRFRVFARVKVSAGTGSFYAKTSATTGTTVTSTSTSYVWVDLGEINSNNSTLEIHAWITTGTVSVDRVEAFLTEDRTRTSPTYSGARDQGQAALYDSRALGAIVARI